MEEKEENKVNTEELKNEASNAVNQVKDTIKKVDIKKDSIETKGFITEMFKNPLEKLREIVENGKGEYLKYAIIVIAIWAVIELVRKCFSLSFSFTSFFNLSSIGNSIWTIIAGVLAPVLSVLVMSVIVLVMNKENKKPLTTIISVITMAKIPVVIAALANILTIFSSQISIVTSPFASFCSVISVVLMYFALKSIFNVEKNSDFIKKFVLVELIYYVAYIIFSLLRIYI